MGDDGVFLSIYTPTYKRPRLLARCVMSVENQTAWEEIQHVVWRDEVGVGIAGMFAEIPRHVDELVGRYVYVLQDDDWLAAPDVVEELQRFVDALAEAPAVVMVKNRKGPHTYPEDWGARPAWAHVDLGNYVVRRDVFAAHAGDFGKRYEGDFDFIDLLWRTGWRFAWCDLVFARTEGWGKGRPESAFALVRGG